LGASSWCISKGPQKKGFSLAFAMLSYKKIDLIFSTIIQKKKAMLTY